MSDAEWEEAYRAAWLAFYTPEHMRTILRRARPPARSAGPAPRSSTILWFYLMMLLRRRASARRRRLPAEIPARPPAGMPREIPFVFYPRYCGRDRRARLRDYWRVYRQCKAILKEALAAPDRWTYTDLAIAPPAAGRIRGAGALSRDHRRRSGARAQAARRFDPLDRPRAEMAAAK